MTTSNRVWTEEHVLTLIRMRRRERSLAEVGRVLGRSKEACRRVLRERAPQLLPKPRKRKPHIMAWATEDIKKLISLKRAGQSWPAISKQMGRSVSSCTRAWRSNSNDAELSGQSNALDIAVSSPWRLRPYERSALSNMAQAYCADTDDLLKTAIETVEHIEQQESKRFSV